MRLLQLEDDGGFSLAEFLDKDIPRYAVLSHTWGVDHEEVTFKDLMDGTGKSKAGYRKIRFCAKQAANDDLRFFWVDTCCINKLNEPEITEAINSMFRWYYNAAKCYVYLSDVSIGGSFGNGLSSQRTWKPAFQRSRWFTRGWTLQELVAPTCVEFFSVEGERLGDKKSLEHEIHEITGIALRALQGSPLSHFGVDERMSWATRRQTKREEDVAYSLLGVFDIHMSLLYGEGRKKALNRLRRKIAKTLRDKSPALPSAFSSKHEIFSKIWPDIFLRERGFNEDGSFVESQRRLWDAEGDTIDIFLSNSKEWIPSYSFEELSTFCRDALLQDINSVDVGEFRAAGRAWMDDRSRYHRENCGCLKNGPASECVRKYKSRLSVAELCQSLGKQRFGVDGIPNADRRLIYIEDPDPDYILALARTASYHQISALVNAIWQHLAFQTSIRIHIPPKGYSIFRLECQLPYFALRPMPDGCQNVPNSTLRKRWTDVSFLEAQSTYPGNEQRYGIAEAQISLAICGSDNWKWVAYSFVDTYMDEPAEDEEEDLYAGCDPYEDFLADPIASDDIDANHPIWDPRTYFLAIFDARSAQVLLEWQKIRNMVERSIRLHEGQKNGSPSLVRSSGTDGDRVELMKDTFDWALNMMLLLCQLQSLLSKTILAWTLFSDSNGEIGYLSGLSFRMPSLPAINERFQSLKVIEQDTIRWERYCKTLAEALELRLTRESNEQAAKQYKEKNGTKEAKELDMEVVETRKRVPGDEHPDTLTSIGNLRLRTGIKGDGGASD